MNKNITTTYKTCFFQSLFRPPALGACQQALGATTLVDHHLASLASWDGRPETSCLFSEAYLSGSKWRGKTKTMPSTRNRKKPLFFENVWGFLGLVSQAELLQVALVNLELLGKGSFIETNKAGKQHGFKRGKLNIVVCRCSFFLRKIPFGKTVSRL